MEEPVEIVINIRLRISSLDYPELAQYLESESNQMRRTRKLCQIATRGLLAKDNNFPVSHIIAPRISTPQLVTDSQKEEKTKIISKVIRRTDNPTKTNRLVDDSIFGDIKSH